MMMMMLDVDRLKLNTCIIRDFPSLTSSGISSAIFVTGFTVFLTRKSKGIQSISLPFYKKGKQKNNIVIMILYMYIGVYKLTFRCIPRAGSRK